MRVLIKVERAGDAWKVTVSGPGLDRQRTMDRIEDGRRGGWFPVPAAGACPEADPEHEDCLRGADAVRRTHDEVAVRREPSDAKTVTRLGRYLFECLIGQDTWEEIKRAAADAGEHEAGVVELALAWDREQHDLNRRMNWELLHDGTHFLAQGCGRADVTITRVVSGAGAEPRELTGLPRVLFAIGAAETDSVIRPGAEILGLLRHVQDDGRTLHHRILEKASPQALARAVQEFRPDVVHFISHGQIEGGESVLLLRPDERDQQEDVPRDATQLLQLLSAGGTLPRLVVLSACESGGGASRLLGGHETAPMATQLVQGGVPVVVGMAGEISDLASRLFARSFGKALLGGTSLVQASAEARRAGLAGGALTSGSADWAFPAVFMSEHVDPARPLVAPGADETAKLVDGWISNYRLNEDPVFCARTEFFDAYWRMTHGGRVRVLAAFVSGDGVGLGRRRLLRELAKQSLRDGHVPLLLGTNGGDDRLRDLQVLCRSVQSAVTRSRRHLGLPARLDGQLSLLRQFQPGQPMDERFDPDIRAELEFEQAITVEAAKLALQCDLAALASDARAAHAHFAAGRVILLLGRLDDTTVELVQVLHDSLLGDHGLGTPDEPVPVVLAFSYSGADNVFRQIKEHRAGYPWLEVRELRPFQEDGEDLLAYEQVMLHPFKLTVMPGVSDKPWVFNRELCKPPDSSQWEAYVRVAREEFEGRPKVFIDRLVSFLNLMGSPEKPFVVKADDEDALAAIRRAGRQP